MAGNFFCSMFGNMNVVLYICKNYLTMQQLLKMDCHPITGFCLRKDNPLTSDEHKRRLNAKNDRKIKAKKLKEDKDETI